MNRDDKSVLERHVHTIVLALLLGLMAWAGNTLVTLDKRAAVIEARVAELSNATASAYTASSAARDHSEVSRRLDKLENRMDRYEAASHEEGRRR